MRARFVFTPTFSLEYQERICFTRSVATAISSPPRQAARAYPCYLCRARRAGWRVATTLLSRWRPMFWGTFYSSPTPLTSKRVTLAAHAAPQLRLAQPGGAFLDRGDLARSSHHGGHARLAGRDRRIRDAPQLDLTGRPAHPHARSRRRARRDARLHWGDECPGREGSKEIGRAHV